MIPNMETAEASDKPAVEAPDAERANSSEGYRLCLDCRADGTYTVTKTEITEGEDYDQPQSFDSFEDALKGLVRLHQASPMDQSQQANFDSGFKSQKMTPY